MSTRMTLEHEFLKQVTDVVEDKLTHPQFGVSMLAKEMGMSRSNLHRRIKSVAGVSVSRFIRDVRLKHAMELLNETDKTCTEIAYDVGFGSVTYFNKCFHDHFGYPPGEVQKDHALSIHNEEQNTLNYTILRKKKRLQSVAFVFILIVIVQAFAIYLFINPFLGSEKKKSIMVLPFKTSSGNPNLATILDGLHYDLITKLEIIEGLNVISSNTSNIYKDGHPDIKEISKNFNVDYLLEGTGQQSNESITIRLRLIDVKTNKYLWSDPINYELEENNIFSFQQEVALRIADSLNYMVTTEEREKIEFLETKNVPAFHSFTIGKNYMDIYNRIAHSNSPQNFDVLVNHLEEAKSYFQHAIELDTAYSQAYVFLGWYYHHKSQLEGFDAAISAAYLDSALLMAEQAIDLHPQHADGYDLQTRILSLKGMKTESKSASDELFRIDKTDWRAYYRVAESHLSFNEYSNALRYLFLAKNQNHEPIEDERVLKNLFTILVQLNFDKVAQQFIDTLLAQENDSIDYFMSLARKDFCLANYENALENQLKAYQMDTNNVESLLQLCIIQFTLGNEKESLYYLDKYEAICNQKNIPVQPNKYLGYIHMKQNNRKEAEFHFNSILTNSKIRLEKGLQNDFGYPSAYEMACIYSVKGNMRKAIEALETYKSKKTCPLWLITNLQNNPMLENVRKRKEYNAILNSLEKKLEGEQAKAERILLDQGIIESWQTKLPTNIFS